MISSLLFDPTDVIRYALLYTFITSSACALIGCSALPNVGPSTKQVEQAADPAANNIIQIIELNDAVARRLLVERARPLFSDSLGESAGPVGSIGPGDGIEIDIWEAPPAALFASGSTDPRAAVSSGASRATTVSEQMVDRDGNIAVPFGGKVKASGQTLAAIEGDIRKRLNGKANHPEIIVRLAHNRSSTVTVVGEVTNSIKMPLTPSGERLLDSLAAAGGVRQPVNKMTVQVTRGSDYFSLPLDTIIRDPRQNVPLRAGDVVTAMFQPLSFTALGATGKNEEINFEAQGISLAQALARAGGLSDSRSDARGVFIFRFEPERALDWPKQPVRTTPSGLVPVVYRIDLRDVSSFFVMQSFQINNRDVLYVSNAPAAELQKFLNLVFSVAYPLLTGIQVTR